MDTCTHFFRRELKSELEQLQARIGDNEKAARQDASVLRDIMGGRMMEMAAKIREAEMYNEECQKIIRKQSQLMGVSIRAHQLKLSNDY